MSAMKEELAALNVLFEVRDAIGRRYKESIRMAWENGRYDHYGLSQWTSQLQHIRNAFGPSWLDRVRPRHLAEGKANHAAITFGDINETTRTGGEA